ncbi:hypothetical protein ABN763_14395 [Spongiivirga sp. MCCC 1A20706]|uniref:hypothetical protein n=1 Tax=Spongiivirga sp. MCCC 1A20706 TaxID=3160963 RepID=UPI003977A756
MKKTIYLMLALLTVSSISVAQHRKGQHQEKKASVFEKFTAEQIATINSKRMTLQLDLTDKQQKAVEALELKEAQFKKTKMASRKQEKSDNKTLSDEERFNRINERLDRQISYKNNLKDILDDDQFAQWKEEMERRKMRRGKAKMKRERRSRK